MRISIDGNIAAGKSTVFASIATSPVADVASLFPEPLDEWGDLLQLYFKDRASWALPLTLDILRGFHRSSKPHGKPHSIVERNPFTCRHVFTEMLRHDAILSNDDMLLVNQYMDAFGWKPDAVVYLDVPVSECQERMDARARPNEASSVSYDELKMIDYMYQKMFREHFSTVPVYRVRQSSGEPMESFLARVNRLIATVLTNGRGPPKT